MALNATVIPGQAANRKGCCIRQMVLLVLCAHAAEAATTEVLAQRCERMIQ